MQTVKTVVQMPVYCAGNPSDFVVAGSDVGLDLVVSGTGLISNRYSTIPYRFRSRIELPCSTS